MAKRLENAVSPYLRAHAGNPVDWWPWSSEAFAEARRRDVPVLVSIGYATCHWCHVMARESFSDPVLAASLNARFVAIKVDREELPEVDAAYLASAAAFTPNLGWPLTAFVTPAGRMFFAGTYFPPSPVSGVPSFAQVLDAVTEAWTQRRAEVEHAASQVHEAIAQAARAAASGAYAAEGMSRDASGAALPDAVQLDAVVAVLAAREDPEFGGFGTAPKFPAAPVLRFLLGRDAGRELAARTLGAIAASPLFDPIDGGFFRYAVRRDWSEPHYERMLYDNAQLLRLAAEAVARGIPFAQLAVRIGRFARNVLRVPGGFASAQDSESVVAGERSEGGYYRLEASARAAEQPPALDRKVLTGWNGLMIGALARAAALLGPRELLELAVEAADELIAAHVIETPDGPRLRRTTLDGRASSAPATLEDYGGLADGLIDLALASGEVRYAVLARGLVDAVLDAGGGGATGDAALDAADAGAAAAEALAAEPAEPAEPGSGPGPVFAVPGGSEPLLAAQGLGAQAEHQEGAYPSGWSLAATASWRLSLLAHAPRHAQAARRAVAAVAPVALAQPISYGAILDLASAIDEGPTQLVIVGEYDAPLADLAARHPAHALIVAVTDAEARAFARAGFELFEARTSRTSDGAPLLYACTDFVCALPVEVE